ncbi:DUF1761 domain-containing protein [Methylobacterium gregans]|uniref:DUF1761 domain-containing protein n=1 Tax=Methylobacterium gregans TaxID=374424 RepID=A0AA37MCJ2_9HYPH|nr:DUF1761 domain-containing protein [Methylobacterium gregans]MDQ0524224.1 hypothetical protein [Methylobacterium gregans]GJD79923.1 hypothetical protein NBEOAGPD_3154 [Methylobacterium gregans]GLS56681.1 hypothetical protein GCM10007886_48670 [Methylobacterium gregans]
MIDALSHVNWLAVLVASVAQFVLGGIWFAGLVAKRYAAALGIADRPRQKPGPLFFGGPLVCGTVIIAATAILLRVLGITTYDRAFALGLLVGLGYLVPMTLTIAINPLFPRPIAYALLNAPFFVAGSLMSCVILTALS